MTFTVNSLTRCSGQNHWTIVVQVGAKQYTITTSPQEMSFDPSDSELETRNRVLERCRSAAKEAGATNFVQSQTAIVGKSYQL